MIGRRGSSSFLLYWKLQDDYDTEPSKSVDARSNKLVVGDVSQSSVAMFKKLIYVLYNMGAHAKLSIEAVAWDQY